MKKKNNSVKLPGGCQKCPGCRSVSERHAWLAAGDKGG